VMTLSVQHWAQLENEAEAGLFSLNCPPTVWYNTLLHVQRQKYISTTSK
jgi:hypothetical protein